MGIVQPSTNQGCINPDARIRQIELIGLIGLWLLYSAFSLYFGQTRPIDGDEGYYAGAAGLVAAGDHPYRDFFYPQGPILPYVYAPVVAVAGHSLRALRILSALMGALAMVPWLLYLRREYGHGCARQGGVGHGSVELGGATLAASALLLLLLDPHLLIWNTTVKTYAFCNLTLSWGLWFLYRGLVAGHEGKAKAAGSRERQAGHVAWFAAAGLAIGLCAGARLLYAPLAAFLAAGLVFRAVWRRDRQATFAAAAFAAGAALTALPLLIAWQNDPLRFWFNVLHYHQIRYSDLRAAGLGASPVARGTAALAAAGRAFLLNPYRLLVLMLAGVGWFSLIRPTWAKRDNADVSGEPDQDSRRTFQVLVGGACAVFVATSLLPDPVYPQYLTPTVGPLMLPAAALGLAVLSRRVLRLAPLGTVVIAVLLATSALLIQKPGIKADVVWSWRSYEAVCDAVRQHSRPGDLVVSFWPGYVFETETRFLPGMENHFALGVSSRLDRAQRQHYRIAGPDLLGDIFRARRAQVIIVGTWMNELDYALSNAQTEALLAEFHRNYVVVDRVDDVAVSVPR